MPRLTRSRAARRTVAVLAAAAAVAGTSMVAAPAGAAGSTTAAPVQDFLRSQHTLGSLQKATVLVHGKTLTDARRPSRRPG